MHRHPVHGSGVDVDVGTVVGVDLPVSVGVAMLVGVGIASGTAHPVRNNNTVADPSIPRFSLCRFINLSLCWPR